VFGSLAKGYKAGGYNSVQPLSRFDNEDVWNVETGVKSLFPEAGVIVNASAFYYVYYDRQAISLAIGDDGIGHYLVDTSDQEAFGLDLDARWQPVDALTLSLGASGSTPRTRTRPLRTARTFGRTDRGAVPRRRRSARATSGRSVPRASSTCPRSTRTAASRVATRNPICRATARSARTSMSAKSKSGTDARLQWSSEDDRWAVAVFVTNLFDDQVVTGSTT
jgi:iron complex outermembrane receptor protein